MSDQQYYSPPQQEADMSNSAAPDDAFEPHSTYMFDEPSTDEEIRNMKRNIASINMMSDANEHAAFDPMNGLTNINHGNQHFQPDFVNPFMFEEPNDGADSTSWQNFQTLPGNIQAMSTQADILSGRSASVAHQYGQITPPDDTTPKSFAAVNQSPANAASHDASSSNAKSERARNAANQRHAKAKKARKDSDRRADTPDEYEETDGKREKYREKNRLAAAKCRAKKKVNTEDLELSAREATTRNNQLRAEERQLRDMFSSLRDQALAHDPTQGCACSAIHAYNMHQAQKAVRGAAMGFQPGAIPSPSQRSIDSGSPSTMAPSRAQSFSSMRPQFSNHPRRSDSMGGHVGFIPSTMGDIGQSNYAFASNTGEQTGENGVAATGDDSNFADYLHQSSDNPRMNLDG